MVFDIFKINNVISIKTKVLLPHAYMNIADVGCPV
jgi:hypothetical protein